MKRCVNCGESDLVRGTQPYTIDVGGRTFAGDVKGWRCRSCSERYYDGRALERFEGAVARWLAEHGYQTGDELRFLRKAAGLRAADLAEALGVSPESVSHWETGKHAPDVATRNVLAALVLDALGGKTTTKDRLKALRSPPRARRVKVGARKAA
ncbi:MAG: helix-turn-helix domain-containing protein [Polyangiaceae bacterium]|nr:helix-turn-helix domain-containing protein [Polyangiaceae bacterium]